MTLEKIKLDPNDFDSLEQGAKKINAAIDAIDKNDGKSTKLNVQSLHSGILSFNDRAFNDYMIANDAFLKDGYFSNSTTALGHIYLAAFKALINGNIINVTGGKNPLSNKGYGWTDALFIKLPDAPLFGTREDLVFLEAWYPQDSPNELKYRIRVEAGVDFKTHPYGLRQEGTSWYSGNIGAQGGNSTPLIPKEGSYSNMVILSSVNNVTDNIARNLPDLMDRGLYMSGRGDQASKDLLKTADGYVYAIPLLRISRRNTTPYSASNPNGSVNLWQGSKQVSHTNISDGSSKFDITAYIKGEKHTFSISDYTQADLDNLQVGDFIYDYYSDGSMMPRLSNALAQITSIDKANKKITAIMLRNVTTINKGVLLGIWVRGNERPDRKYANWIVEDDIIDLRHKVALDGIDFQGLLKSSFDGILRGSNTVNDNKKVVNEHLSLSKAPLYVPPTLQGTNVKGDDGVTRNLVNLLGRFGEIREQFGDGLSDGWFPSSLNNYTVVNNRQRIYAKVADGTPYRYVGRGGIPMDSKKYYVMIARAYASGTDPKAELLIRRTGDIGNVSTLDIRTDTVPVGSSATLLYKKFKPAEDYTSTFYFYNKSDVGKESMVEYDNLAIYEISKEDYDKIDVDAGFTGFNLLNKFPFTNSYPSVVRNLLPDISKATLIGSVNETTGAYALTSSDVTFNLVGRNEVEFTSKLNYMDCGFAPVQVKPNTIYTVRVDLTYMENLPGNGGCYPLVMVYKDIPRAGNVDNSDLLLGKERTGGFNSPRKVAYTFTTGATAKYVCVSVSSGLGGSNLKFKNLELLEGEFDETMPAIPYGKWYLPYDLADSKAEMTQLLLSQKSVSDKQSIEFISDVVEVNGRTPQKNITVSQATAGKWSVNDTITIDNPYGVVTGVVDTDTALANIISSSAVANGYETKTFLVDNASKIDVGDKVNIYNSTKGVVTKTDVTITAVDKATNTVTTDISVGFYTGEDYVLLEVSATSSTPSMFIGPTAVQGTWTGLGTSKATFKFTAEPTASTSDVSLGYCMSYPPGGGIKNVPNPIGATVNGQKLIKSSDGLSTIRVNFENKVPGSTELVPHVIRRSGAEIMKPPSSTRTECEQTQYKAISKMDGSKLYYSGQTNTYQAQLVFDIDIIRALTDKFGQGFFNNCITLQEKIAKARNLVKTIKCNVWGYGIGPSGNSITMKRWLGDVDGWYGDYSHTYPISFNSFQVLTTKEITDGKAIDSNGFAYFAVNSEASDGVTKAVLQIDYADIEITVDFSDSECDVFVPDEQKTVLHKNWLTANQAYPVDAEALSVDKEFINVTPNISTYIKKPGILRVDINDSSSTTLYNGIRINNLYKKTGESTFIFNFLGKAGDRYRVFFYSDSKVDTGMIDFVATGSTQRLSIYHPNMDETTHIRVEAVSYSSYFELSYMMLADGNCPNDNWVHGRYSYYVTNFAGKVASSQLENPHILRRFYDANFLTPAKTTTDKVETSQYAYDAVANRDGIMMVNESSVVGTYFQEFYEFDLSHLGYSLTELKRVVKRLNFGYTGFGQGDNAGVLTYGVTGKVYNHRSKQWVLSDALTASLANKNAPTTGYTNPAVPSDCISDDQKFHILVHTTYPASAQNKAIMNTEYVRLWVELLGEADYVRSNVVKVLKETKEIKISTPPDGFRDGIYDSVSLSYEYTPYQSLSEIGDRNRILAVGKAVALTMGTGGTTPNVSGKPATSPYTNAITRLPSLRPDYRYTPINLEKLFGYKTIMSEIDFVTMPYNYDGKQGCGALKENEYISHYVAWITNPYRSTNSRAVSINLNENMVNKYNDVSCITMNIGLKIPDTPYRMLVALPVLVEKDGAIRLIVYTCDNTNLNAPNGRGWYGADVASAVYEIPGRPLIK